MSLFRLLTLLSLLLAASGCRPAGPPGPKTYPVQGKVVYKNGQPYPGGAIEFRPTAGEPHNAVGVIGPEGSFKLQTLGGNVPLAGAVEGTFQVTITPRIDQDPKVKSVPTPFTLP